MMSLARKAGLAVTGVVAVIFGVIVEEIEWRLTGPRGLS